MLRQSSARKGLDKTHRHINVANPYIISLSAIVQGKILCVVQCEVYRRALSR